MQDNISMRPSQLQSRPTGALDIRGKCIIWQQAPAILTNKGTRYCGQAVYVWKQAPVFSANEGTSHPGWATLLVAMYKRVLMGQQHDHAKNGLNRSFFSWEKQQHVHQPWYKGWQNRPLIHAKIQCWEVKIAQVYGAPLKRRAEQVDKLCILSNYLRALDKW